MNDPAVVGGGAPMRLLVSVRSVDEARLAARAGVDLIDLKEPAQGALGGLPVATIRAIVAALREAGCRSPVSATIGDWPAAARDGILAAVDAVGACGVDYVKVGIAHDAAPTGRGAAPTAGAAPAAALLHALAASRWPVVPVFVADDGIDGAAVALACRLRAQHGAGCFPALMVDTADKRRGSLFAQAPVAALHAFVAQVRAAGALAGLAGALRLDDLPSLAALSPDFAGFRSAVCAGDRAGALDAGLLDGLLQRLHGHAVGGPPR